MITFNGLGLKFNINPIAINIFGVDIYWYGICILTGTFVGLLLCRFSKKNYGIKFDDVFNTIIFAILFGIIGARIYYVIFNLEYYSKNISQIIVIRNGGLAIFGGLIFGALAIWIKCKISKINSMNFFDYIIPSVAIAQCIGRWGNFFNQEAYGTECTNIFRMGINTPNGFQEVHPTFLYESLGLLIIFIYLKYVQKRQKFDGEIFLKYLVCYSGIRMLIEGLRIDSLMFFYVRISQVLALVIFVGTSIILLEKYIKTLIQLKNVEICRPKKENKCK